ncbi:MAG TPA: (2Fe-2S)-binding protein [Syntrophorhabdaceae bacterium]|nr:(2Fe-2S)-binding protein [Syntrophorhabdaceae bacterium]
MKTIKVTLNVNNEKIILQVKPYETLLETLRERLSLTGAKESCSLGSCGACTVLVNGTPVRSCLILTPEVDGATITTIEGLKDKEKLHPLQHAFMEKGAVQCGFCTPGMIMTAKALLDRNKKPEKKDIIKTISSNICRCTGYKKIIEAVEEVSKTSG